MSTVLELLKEYGGNSYIEYLLEIRNSLESWSFVQVEGPGINFVRMCLINTNFVNLHMHIE